MAVQNKKPRFPTLAVILLAIGIIWLLNALNIFPWQNIPWIPVVVIIIAIGLILNRYI